MIHRCPAPLFASLLVLAACTDPSDPGASADDSGTAADSSGGSSSSEGGLPGTDTGIVPPDPTTGDDPPTDLTTTGWTTSEPATTTGDPTPSTTTGEPDDTTTTTTTDATTTTGDTTGDDTTGGVQPGDGGALPLPSMPCPDLVDGVVDIHPAGVASPRAVRIWVDPAVAAEKDGPVVFYWHGTGGQPEEALSGLGDLGVQEILDMGGLVVAPTHDPAAGVFPWFLVLGQQQDDLRVADEALACAAEQYGVDAARIHSLGFSAGGLHTAQMSVRRSDYLASVVLYSGGLIFGSMPMFADPTNDFPAMIFHGGPSDVVVVGFQQASEDYQTYIGDAGSFSFICNHGTGHTIPPAQDSVMLFFADHPWGAAPDPYVGSLPDGFPDYCSLP